MAPNGRLSTSSLFALPARWSNKGEVEYLETRAGHSLSRALNRAVADSGENFQLYDAYRSFEEQVAILQDYYYPVKGGRRPGDRAHNGVTYRKRSGKPAAASPGHSNHGTGLAIDIHHGGIQQWFQSQGRTYGWTWDEGRDLGESWHFVYDASLDQMAHEGYLDHAAVQKAVDAEVDGKIGTGTVAKIKAWQKANGLTVDGKVGATTKRAMGLSGASSPVVVTPASPASVHTAGGFSYTFARDDWDTQGVADEVHPYDAPVEGIYLHWPASNTDFAALDAERIATVLRGYRRDHQDNRGWFDFGYGAAVDMAGRTYQGRGLDMEVGSNGGSASNSGAGSILLLAPVGGKPSAAMVDATNGLLAQYGDKYGKGFIEGHRNSPDASTDCPGDTIQSMIDGGTFNWDGSTGAVIPGGKLTPSLHQLIVDGRAGTDTIKALQRFLNNRVGADLKVDGRAGAKTWAAFQEYLSAPYTDGEISRQSYEAEELGNGIVPGDSWGFTGRGSDGSQTVVLGQRWCGVPDDGIWFEQFTRGLQAKLNVHKVGM